MRSSVRITSRTLIGDVAHLGGIRTDHAKLDGKADRRPEVEPIDAHPRRAQRAIGDRRFETRLDPFARLDVFGDDHDLRKASFGWTGNRPSQNRGDPLPI